MKLWTPLEIKAELILKNVKQSDIAQSLGVSSAMVTSVIKNKRVSKRVRKAIATAIGENVADIWPAA